MRHEYAAANSAASAPQLQYRQFADVGVTSGTVYACSGNKYLYTLGNTYSPVGQLGGIEPIDSPSDVQPKTLRLWLNAVNSTQMFEAAREDMFNRRVAIRYGYTDPQTDVIVSTPMMLWEGFVNKVDFHFGDEERGNFFEVEAETSMRRKAEIVNFNKETHQTVLSFSGDTFFNYLDQVPMVKAMWGNQPTAFNGDRGADSFVGRLRYMYERRRGGR